MTNTSKTLITDAHPLFNLLCCPSSPSSDAQSNWISFLVFSWPNIILAQHHLLVVVKTMTNGSMTRNYFSNWIPLTRFNHKDTPLLMPLQGGRRTNKESKPQVPFILRGFYLLKHHLFIYLLWSIKFRKVLEVHNHQADRREASLWLITSPWLLLIYYLLRLLLVATDLVVVWSWLLSFLLVVCFSLSASGRARRLSGKYLWRSLN